MLGGAERARGACGSASGRSCCWWRSTRWRVAAPAPAWPRGAGPRPLDLPPHRRGVRVPGEALRGGAGPPLAPSTPAPPRRLQDFAPRPLRGTTPDPAPPHPLPTRGDGGQCPRGRHPRVPPVPRCRGAGRAPQLRSPHAAGAGSPPAPGGATPYISPPLTTLPTAPCSSSPPGPAQPPPAPRARGAVPGGWSHTLPRAATEAGHRRPRGPQPTLGGPEPPGTARRCPGQRPAGSGCRGVAGAGGGRGAHPHRRHPRGGPGPVRAPPQRQQVRYTGGSPGPTPTPGSPPGATTTPLLQRHLRLPGSPPGSSRQPPRSLAEPGGFWGSPGTAPRGGRRCMPRRCARPCRASGGTRRPTPTQRPRGGRGGPVAALPRCPHLQQQQQQPGEHRGPPGGCQPAPGL
ncbi:unnamed protein product, partial [Bubo scandiacus]